MQLPTWRINAEKHDCQQGSGRSAGREKCPALGGDGAGSGKQLGSLSITAAFPTSPAPQQVLGYHSAGTRPVGAAGMDRNPLNPLNYPCAGSAPLVALPNLAACPELVMCSSHRCRGERRVGERGKSGWQPSLLEQEAQVSPCTQHIHHRKGQSGRE